MSKETTNRVVKKFGGRHLVFRTHLGRKSFLPRAYALVSAFEGTELFFYGIGKQNIEGTIVVEKGVIEFHWTFGHELETEKVKDENKSPLSVEFEALAKAFAALQPAR